MRKAPHIPGPRSSKNRPSPADREIELLNNGVRGEINNALATLGELRDLLGDKPIDAVRTNPDQHERLLELAGEGESQAAELASVVRVLVKVHSLPDPVNRQKIRNGFNGEAHLEDIEVEVVLTLDPRTGLVKSIKILPPTDTTTRGDKRRHELRTAISGSELVKETLVQNWSKDAKALRRLEENLEQTLLRSGTITKDGQRLRVTKLTPGQLPSSRAWVNPDRDLRAKWEPKRKALGRERLKVLESK